MASTEHYNLQKPAPTDYYNVAVQNSNMDAIDEAMHDLETGKVANDGDISDTVAGSITTASGSYPTFSAGQKLSVILGRIAKFFADLKANCITKLEASGRTVTYTKANGTTGTFTTQDTTYSNATTGTAGLMSAADKTKLNGIAPGAAVSGIKGDAESTYRTGNVNLTPAQIGALYNFMITVPTEDAPRDRGYMISNGLLIQWGDCSIPAGSSDAREVTLTQQYLSTNAYVVMAAVEGVSNPADVTIRVQRTAANKFKVRCFNNGTPVHTIAASYLAVGVWRE